MMRFLFVLLLFISSTPAFCLDTCDKDGELCDRGEILIYNSPECLWAITPLQKPAEGNKAKAFSDFSNLLNSKTRWGEYKLKAWKKKKSIVESDLWWYEYREDFGVVSACASRMPSRFQRSFLTYANGVYTVTTNNIGARRHDETGIFFTEPGAYEFGVFHWDKNEEYPVDDKWSWGGELAGSISFTDGELTPPGQTIENREKGLVSWDVCLVKYKKGDSYNNGHYLWQSYGVTPQKTYQNTNFKNKICAYIYPKMSECKEVDEDDLIGCIDQPPQTGPDVFNSVIPSKKAPYVDTKRCLEKEGKNAGKVDANCEWSEAKKSLREFDSTFDKPVVIITTGEGDVEPNILKLTYQFHNADFDANKPICGTINLPGYEMTEYCAIVPPENPGKVCACIKDATIDYNQYGINENPNYCGIHPIMGCVDRPTMEHSELTYVGEAASYTDPKTKVQYPAARLSIVEADANGRAKYKDKNGKLACTTNGKDYYVCQPNGVDPTATKSTEPLSFVRRLKVPTYYTSESLIREYYPSTQIPPYTDDLFNGSNASCEDSNKHPVHYDKLGNFKQLGSNGQILGNKPVGDVSCKYNNKKVSGASIKPQGYQRDSKKFYGVEFTAQIPKIDQNSNILVGRYTNPATANCMPVRFTGGGLCDNIGVTSFVPAGLRDTSWCPKVPDANDAVCVLDKKGVNDPEAMKLFCPGIMKNANADGGDTMCIEGSKNTWRFETIDEYYKVKNEWEASDFFQQECRQPVKSNHCARIAGTIQIPAMEPSADSGFAKFPEVTPIDPQNIKGTTDASGNPIVRIEIDAATGEVTTTPYDPSDPNNPADPGVLGVVQTGECVAEMGYTERALHYPQFYGKMSYRECWTDWGVTFSFDSANCDSQYGDYENNFDQYVQELEQFQKVAHKLYNKNLSESLYKSLIVKNSDKDSTQYAQLMSRKGLYAGEEPEGWYIDINRTIHLKPQRTVNQYGEVVEIKNACVTLPPLDSIPLPF